MKFFDPLNPFSGSNNNSAAPTTSAAAPATGLTTSQVLQDRLKAAQMSGDVTMNRGLDSIEQMMQRRRIGGSGIHKQVMGNFLSDFMARREAENLGIAEDTYKLDQADQARQDAINQWYQERADQQSMVNQQKKAGLWGSLLGGIGTFFGMRRSGSGGGSYGGGGGQSTGGYSGFA
jgi:hypothetical protein